MFEDDNEQYDSAKEKEHLSNRDSLTNNSAVKAAIFVTGLTVCIIIIYWLIISFSPSDPTIGGTSKTPAGSSTPSGSDTNVPGTTEPSETPTEDPAQSPGQSEEPFTTLQKGSKSEKVKELQQYLKDKKYLDESVELAEDFGAKTETAVKLFQKENSLEETGVVDKALFDKIASAPVREEQFEFKRGDSHEKIKEMQILLIEKKYLNIKKEEAVTVYGPQTELAVKLFQKENGFPETGIVTNTLFNSIKNAPVRSTEN